MGGSGQAGGASPQALLRKPAKSKRASMLAAFRRDFDTQGLFRKRAGGASPQALLCKPAKGERVGGAACCVVLRQ